MNMVEKVARAIFDAKVRYAPCSGSNAYRVRYAVCDTTIKEQSLWGYRVLSEHITPDETNKAVDLHVARAAIQAMREPTPHMIIAGVYGDENDAQSFRQMIDAALNESDASP